MLINCVVFMLYTVEEPYVVLRKEIFQYQYVS